MGVWGAKPPSAKNFFMQELHDQLCDWDNLLNAYYQAAKGKRGRPDVAAFEYHLGDELVLLQQSLLQKTYQPSPYQSFYIHEPKRRLISAAPFRDRVVHHALCNVMTPYFEQAFLPDSYANRIDKGTHRAIDRVQQFAKRFTYFLPCDVEQFFPAMDHAILLNVLKKLLPRCGKSVMWLIERILTSGKQVLTEEYVMRYFAGDDLFAQARPRGLPIGNLTSQWWANCYLNSLDQFVKREMGSVGYVRYVDDFVLFANEIETLHTWRAALISRLAALRLTLHEPQCYPRPCETGIAFLGFFVFPHFRRLKPRKGYAFWRKFQQTTKNNEPHSIRRSLLGWINHTRYADTYGLRRATLLRFNLLYE